MAYFRETDCGIIAGMKKAHLCPSLQKIRRYPLLLKEHLKKKTSSVMKINATLSVLGLLPFTKKEKKTANFNWCTLNRK